MPKRVLVFLLIVSLVGSLACLEIRGTHTLYLSADGTVIWSVLEQGIRFDGPTLESRQKKEDEFLDRVAASEHVAARALVALYPGSLTARVLREQTPQAILTEAYFPGIDRVFQNLFTFYGLPATVELVIEEQRAQLEIRFWMSSDESEEQDGDDGFDEILLALLSECRIVLTEGHFTEARGFEIVEGGRVARPTTLDTEAAEEFNTPVELSLTWTIPDERDDGSSHDPAR